jgi:hypothetical protein
MEQYTLKTTISNLKCQMCFPICISSSCGAWPYKVGKSNLKKRMWLCHSSFKVVYPDSYNCTPFSVVNPYLSNKDESIINR